ncbi:MAG: alcohol dehydrogenase catalytic domain-containing protein [Christensenellales bacterium]
MLACRMYGKDDIRLENIDIPSIGKEEILLKVKAASVCGTDIRMIKNGYNGIDENSPRILGHEFSGIIEKVGGKVTQYSVGQRIAVAPNMGCGVCDNCVAGNGHLCRDYKALGINMDGAFAEYVRIPKAAVSGGNVAVLPDNVSFEEAAINEALSCVCNGFERCDIRPGDKVLVIGAGPIGIMHAKLAKMAGAKVYVNDLSEERLALCEKIDGSFVTVSGDPIEFVEKETAGAGVNVCITACPAPAAQNIALRVTGINGRINFFGGVPASKQPVALDTNLIHYKQLIVSATTRASLTQFRKTLNFIASDVLSVRELISNTFALRDIDRAFAKSAAAEGLKNVVVM